LKEKQDANADVTVVARCQGVVDSITAQIVVQLALKEAKEKLSALLEDKNTNPKRLSAEKKEIYYKDLIARAENEVKKLEADVDTITKALLGLNGTLHELIAGAQSC
jgi:hypothetical protein